MSQDKNTFVADLNGIGTWQHVRLYNYSKKIVLRQNYRTPAAPTATTNHINSAFFITET